MCFKYVICGALQYVVLTDKILRILDNLERLAEKALVNERAVWEEVFYNQMSKMS